MAFRMSFLITEKIRTIRNNFPPPNLTACPDTSFAGNPLLTFEPVTDEFVLKIINSAPRHYHHSTPLLEKLPWLSISECIKYKVAWMCFSAISGSGSTYLSELLHVYTPSRTLHFLWCPNAGNPTIQTQDSWLSHLLLLCTPHLEFTATRS